MNRRKWIGIALSTVAAVVGLSASSASAETALFSYTGTEQAFVIPPRVTALTVTAVGGRGGAGSTLGGAFPPGGPGGFGARVVATVPVTPGQTVFVEVGGNGGSASTQQAFNGGGPSAMTGADAGGGGGGASDIRVCSRASTCPALGSAQDQRLVVAGGGGGGGSTGLSAQGGGGGPGGALGSAGSNGSVSPGGTGGVGGMGGTLIAGGAGGAAGSGNNPAGLPGLPGTAGQGGAGQAPGTTNSPGGGGGGGYFGGGGGGGGGRDSGGQVAGGGGGGSGSSYVTSSASAVGFSTDSAGTPLVELSYVQDPAPPPPDPETTITKRPKKKTRARKVTFKFTSDQSGATFQCSFDRSDFKPCGSPKNYRAELGRHRFAVRAVSSTGIPDPTPAHAKVKVIPRLRH